MEPKQILQMPRTDNEHVARENHDEVCQYVAAAQMLFATFRTTHPQVQPHDWCSFDKGMELLEQANREMRRLTVYMRI